MPNYVNNQKWGRWAIWFQIGILFFLLLTILSVGLDYMNLAFFARGQEYPVNIYDPALLKTVLKTLWALLVLPGVGVYLWWLYRAYGNLHIIASGWRFNCKMAAIGWVIPIANLFIPYLVIDDLFRLTSEYLRINYSKVYYRLWWFFWLFTQLLGLAAFWRLKDLYTLEQVITANKYMLCYYTVFSISIGLNVKTIKDYVKMETLLYQQITDQEKGVIPSRAGNEII